MGCAKMCAKMCAKITGHACCLCHLLESSGGPAAHTDMARVVLLYSRCIDARARPVLCVVACCECCI